MGVSIKKLVYLILILSMFSLGHANNFVQLNSKLSSELFDSLYEESTNLLISPYSISNSILMLYMGTSSINEYEIKHILNLQSEKGTICELASQIRKELLDYRLKNSMISYQTLWIHSPHKISNDYLNIAKIQFGAEVESCDLANPKFFKARHDEWVYQKTRKKIGKNFTTYEPRATTLAIMTDISTLKCLWKSSFPTKGNFQAPFFSSQGNINQEYMSQVGEFDFYEDEQHSIVSLPMDNDLKFLAVLPKNNSYSLKNESITSILKTKLTPSRIFIQLPKFSISKPQNLNHSLMSIGLIRLFSRGSDFTNISQSGNLYLSDYLHQTHIAINEWGIDGSSSLFSLSSRETQSNETIQGQFIANSTFLFLIIDTKQDIVLFLGTYSTPG
ncbi:MAG: serpin family protein [Rhabdochlamydiaceae bacterium]|nr:serpin family protein [Candidatus Amphrikana amoebophyrae]